MREAFPWLEDVVRDLRYGLRVLKRSPVFTTVAILTLALGIGANAAIFHLIDTISFRSLPIPNAHELVDISAEGIDGIGITVPNRSVTYHLWEQIRTHQRAFTGLFAWGSGTFFVGRGADARPAEILWVSADFFRVLGGNAARGRLLDGSDDSPECSAATVVVSDDFWRTVLGGSESVVGSTLTIADQPVTIVGVTPAGFTGLEVGRTFDVALPLCVAAQSSELGGRRDVWFLRVMGRLRADFTVAAADQHLRALSRPMLDATIPEGYSPEISDRYRKVELGVDPAGRGVSPLRETHGTSLLLLLGLTGIVLLITCGNLATLMLARAGAREREIATRVAVGASRRRLVWQTVSESLLVAAAGAALAVPVALASAKGLVTFLDTPSNPIQLTLTADWRLIAFVIAAGVLTTVLFGLVPALRVSMTDPTAAMRESSRAATTGRRRARLRRGLVAAQIALSLVLVVSAVLFVRSFRNLSAVELGFDPAGVIVVGFFDLAGFELPIERRLAFQQELTTAIRSVPGVAEAASSTHVPLSGSIWSHSFRVANESDGKGSWFAYVGPGYFDALRVPVLAGRDFDEHDHAASRRVLLVNQSFVRHHLGGRPPIGVTLRTAAELGYPETTYEIIGVVGDTKYRELRNDECLCEASRSEPKVPIAYVPIAQIPDLLPWQPVIVRASGPTLAVTSAIAERLEKLNPGMVVQFTELDSIIRTRATTERALAWLAGAFGILAIVLVVVGLYGMIAYLAVSRRTEVGIRLSLGSTRAQIVGLILRDSFVLVAVGVLVGLPLAVITTRSAEALLFGISPADFVTLAGATSLLAAATVLAGGVPALRSALLPPMAAIRDEPESMWRTTRLKVRQAIQDRAAANDQALVAPVSLIAELTGQVQRADSFVGALDVGLTTLREKVGAESIALLQKAGDEYRAAHIAIPSGGVLLNRLTHYRYPLALTAGELHAWLQWARESRPQHVAEVEQLQQAHVRMAVALRTRHEIVGVLLFGPPAGRERFTQSDKQLLESAAEVFALMIENARLTDRAVEQEKVRRDLALAAEVQRGLLPARPPHSPAAALAAFTLPARSIGGDCYDFVELPDGRIGIAVADVAGKGVAAALLTSVVQSSLRMILAEGSSAEALAEAGAVAPAELAMRMNRFLHRSAAAGKYATFFYAELDSEGRRLRYVNAGHNPPYLVRRADAGITVTELSAGGTVLGLFSEAEYEDAEVDLRPGDLIVAFTDGVPEARNSAGDEFGEERLKDLLQHLAGVPAEQVSSALAAGIRDWMVGAEQHDDVTVVVAVIGGSPVGIA